MDEIAGGGTIATDMPLEVWLFSHTTTGPVLAPTGTVAMIVLVDQLVTAPGTPLNVTWPFPCNGPKFTPLIATDCPARAFELPSEVIVGPAPGSGTVMRESLLPLRVPSRASSPRTDFLPAVTPTRTPAHT